MTIHLSTRLTWHDTGWEGRVCADPIGNVSCLVHDHIRDSRDDQAELEHAGRLLSEIDFRPPCSRDPGIYSETGYRLTHRDPLEWRGLPSVDEDLPPYSVSTSPYGRMFAENGGWEYDPGRQLERLTEFFDALTPVKSLVFFYLKDGQPFVETNQRIIAGIGRIKKVGPQRYFGGSDDHGRPYPVWSRAIEQDYPAQGLRLPLQEYLRAGADASPIICLVPDHLTASFSYVAEHVSDDAAVTVIERIIDAVRAARDGGVVSGPWDQHLAWLEQVLGEVWSDRGPWPGIASVLSYLGCPSSVTFQRDVLGRLAPGTNIWAATEAFLDGRSPAPPSHDEGLKRAAERWAREPESRRDLMRALARFDLTVNQVERILHPTKRADAGITATDEEILANPFMLCELDLGTNDSEPIAFDSIDHGLLPRAGLHTDGPPIRVDDDRRVRAVLLDVLKGASAEGDTIISLDEASRRVEKRLANDRRCLPDPVALEAAAEFFEERLSFLDVAGGRVVASRVLSEDEALIRDRLNRMVEKQYDVPELDWRSIVDRVLARAEDRGSQDEESARQEKAAALRQALPARLSVITGRAGTGKTTVARALIEAIGECDGHGSSLLLAPTGKARTRLQQIAGTEAKTIHQFLAETGWISFDNRYALRRDGGKTEGAATVLIDEASMIPTELLATLFRAISWNDVRRLVLVGDPNQLPPIGSGRPFADIIAWLDADDARRERLIQLQYGGRFSEAASLGLRLSDGYARPGKRRQTTTTVPALVAHGETANSDLEVRF